ncbi:MAG: RNA polymerase subunit sigma-24, partial [Acidobacteriales bacterium]
MVAQWRAGDHDAFTTLVERHKDKIYWLVRRIAGAEEAEDLTQEVFIVGAHRAAAGDPVDLPWLIAVARHKLIDHWRA